MSILLVTIGFLDLYFEMFYNKPFCS